MTEHTLKTTVPELIKLRQAALKKLLKQAEAYAAACKALAERMHGEAQP